MGGSEGLKNEKYFDGCTFIHSSDFEIEFQFCSNNKKKNQLNYINYNKLLDIFIAYYLIIIT